MKKVVPKNAILVPDNASLVFKGKIFDTYQWEQKMFDNSVKTFEMLKRPDTVLIFAVHDNKLILVEDEQPNRSALTGLSGGRVDPEDESWLMAAKRELLEETGYSFNNWKLISVIQPQRKIESFVPIYLATDLNNIVDQSLDLEGEKIKVIMTSYEDFRNISLKDELLDYSFSILVKCRTLEELLALPEYTGKVIDR